MLHLHSMRLHHHIPTHQAVRTPLGAFQQVTTCNRCEGQGQSYTACERCGGDGRERETKRIQLTVPAGMNELGEKAEQCSSSWMKVCAAAAQRSSNKHSTQL